MRDESGAKKKKNSVQVFPSKYLALSIVILVLVIGITIYYFSQNRCEDVPDHLAYPNAELISERYPGHRDPRLEFAFYEYETIDTRQEIVEFYEANYFRCRNAQTNPNRTACRSPNLEDWYDYTVFIDDTTGMVSLAVEMSWYIDCQGYIYPW